MGTLFTSVLLAPALMLVQGVEDQSAPWELGGYIGFSKTPQELSLPAGISWRVAVSHLPTESTALGLEAGFLSLGTSATLTTFSPIGGRTDTTVVVSRSDERNIYIQGLLQWRPTLSGVGMVLTAGGGIMFRNSTFATTQLSSDGEVIFDRTSNFRGVGPSATLGVGLDLAHLSRSFGLRLETRLYGAVLSSGGAISFVNVTLGIWFR